MLPGPPKKAARKRHTEAIKQSREERCRRLPIAKASGLCLRVPTRPPRENRNARGLLPSRKPTLASRGSCGVLLVVSPPSCLQSRTPRVAADISAPPAFLWDAVGAFNFGACSSAPCPANTSERPELRAVVVSAGATLRAALIYTGLATAHASATKSSSVGDSRPRTTLRPDPTHARAARR